MNRRLLRGVLGIAVLFLALPIELRAQPQDQGPVFIALEENDMVIRTDRHYTQGIKFAFLHQDGFLPGVVGGLWRGIPKLGFEPQVGKFGYQVGQNIYTPGDITDPEPLPNDRPYAGWLYTGFILHRRGATAGWLTLESFEMQLGIIGPPSLAEQAQTWIHEIRGLELPQGWDNQLQAEPGLALRYDRAVRFSVEGREPQYSDIIPHAGFSLGNTETSFRIGATLRIGVNLPQNFGVQTISSLTTSEGGRPSTRERSSWGFYVFTGIDGWAVAYTVFLDGNLYQDSPHVSKEPLVAEWKSGFAFVSKWVELGFTYVERSREFTSQDQDNAYGSLWMKVPF